MLKKGGLTAGRIRFTGTGAADCRGHRFSGNVSKSNVLNGGSLNFAEAAGGMMAVTSHSTTSIHGNDFTS